MSSGQDKACPASLKTSLWLVFRTLVPALAASRASIVLAPTTPSTASSPLVALRGTCSARADSNDESCSLNVTATQAEVNRHWHKRTTTVSTANADCIANVDGGHEEVIPVTGSFSRQISKNASILKNYASCGENRQLLLNHDLGKCFRETGEAT